MSTPSLAGTGFSWETPVVPPSVILSLEGLEKSGRTKLACEGPEPIAYQGLDTGEDTMEAARAAGKKIASVIYNYPKYDPSAKGAVADKQAEEIRKTVWDKFTRDYFHALKHFRTVIWDTASEVWELIRLANFGKLSQVPEIAYPDVNADFKELVRAAKNAHVNLMLIHQMKEERERKIEMTSSGPKEKSVPTGRLVRAGMNKLGYLVDSYVLTRYIRPTFAGKGADRRMTTEGKFEVEVLEARHAKPTIGTIIENPTLLELLSVIRPDIKVADWGLGELATAGVEIEL